MPKETQESFIKIVTIYFAMTKSIKSNTKKIHKLNITENTFTNLIKKRREIKWQLYTNYKCLIDLYQKAIAINNRDGMKVIENSLENHPYLEILDYMNVLNDKLDDVRKKKAYFLMSTKLLKAIKPIAEKWYNQEISKFSKIPITIPKHLPPSKNFREQLNI